MEITTSYTVALKRQLEHTCDGTSAFAHQVDDTLMRATSNACLEALKLCMGTFLEKWGFLSSVPDEREHRQKNPRRETKKLMYSMERSAVPYPEFCLRFQGLPSYTRCPIISDVPGIVISYVSDHKNRETLSTAEHGKELYLGLPERYVFTLYDKERKLGGLSKSHIGLKLFNCSFWSWHCSKTGMSDAKYLARLSLVLPTVRKVQGPYKVTFFFMGNGGLAQEENRFAYRMLGAALASTRPPPGPPCPVDASRIKKIPKQYNRKERFL